VCTVIFAKAWLDLEGKAQGNWRAGTSLITSPPYLSGESVFGKYTFACTRETEEVSEVTGGKEKKRFTLAV